MFKPGDTVSLKSGGPLMTIMSIFREEGVEWASCVWFEKNKENKGSYPTSVLVADDGMPVIA